MGEVSNTYDLSTCVGCTIVNIDLLSNYTLYLELKGVDEVGVLKINHFKPITSINIGSRAQIVNETIVQTSTTTSCEALMVTLQTTNNLITIIFQND